MCIFSPDYALLDAPPLNERKSSTGSCNMMYDTEQKQNPPGVEEKHPKQKLKKVLVTPPSKFQLKKETLKGTSGKKNQCSFPYLQHTHI
jgi:hypothetical protein